MRGVIMDKLDIFALEKDLKIIVTVNELQRLYAAGVVDGSHDERNNKILVKGDIA